MGSRSFGAYMLHGALQRGIQDGTEQPAEPENGTLKKSVTWRRGALFFKALGFRSSGEGFRLKSVRERCRVECLIYDQIAGLIHCLIE